MGSEVFRTFLVADGKQWSQTLSDQVCVVNGHIQQPCPTPEELLRASSGDLSPNAGRAVVEHLRECGSCRATLSGLLRTLAEVAAARDDSESPAVQDAAWMRFLAALHAQKQAIIHQPPGSGPAPWWSLVAGSLVLALGLVLTRGSVAVQADEVLRRAGLAEEFMSASPRRWLRLDVRPLATQHDLHVSLSIDRETGRDSAGLSDPIVQRGLPDVARRLLTGHRLNWREPMSPLPFQHWRAGSSAAARHGDATLGSHRRADIDERRPRAGSEAGARSRQLSRHPSAMDSRSHGRGDEGRTGADGVGSCAVFDGFDAECHARDSGRDRNGCPPGPGYGWRGPGRRKCIQVRGGDPRRGAFRVVQTGARRRAAAAWNASRGLSAARQRERWQSIQWTLSRRRRRPCSKAGDSDRGQRASAAVRRGTE
jgi:hypothetical protein